MGRWNRIVALVGAAIWIGGAGVALSGELVGRVVQVSDGDTITILDSDKKQHKIRLTGVDAPERSQAFGRKSRENLALLIAGQQVTVEYFKRDHYGRVLGKILYQGKDVNLEQIRAGFAWHFKKFKRDQLPADRKLYADAESEARAKKAGLWSDSAPPTPPWEYRKQTRGKKRKKGVSVESD